ncbi:hypothetical protein PENTCL1PPCAC_29513 [Pristionchus entomophagus]|uniref:C2H2-type domain-containing protein n=1 Tax=Pristionchus entomophagus TaxID=358040 RepID=A0AAV5UK41_9BILA|nr:hypothetical protein PENTCL1PPCAC_29513 [Pristionchus entomophagus]
MIDAYPVFRILLNYYFSSDEKCALCHAKMKGSTTIYQHFAKFHPSHQEKGLSTRLSPSPPQPSPRIANRTPPPPQNPDVIYIEHTEMMVPENCPNNQQMMLNENDIDVAMEMIDDVPTTSGINRTMNETRDEGVVLAKNGRKQDPRDAATKPFKCKHCGWAFAAVYHLRIHQQIHSISLKKTRESL